MNNKVNIFTLVALISTSWLFTCTAYADASIDIIDGKADENKGKIAQIEEETNAALMDFQGQIDALAALVGTQDPPIMYKGQCSVNPTFPPGFLDVGFCLDIPEIDNSNGHFVVDPLTGEITIVTPGIYEVSMKARVENVVDCFASIRVNNDIKANVSRRPSGRFDTRVQMHLSYTAILGQDDVVAVKLSAGPQLDLNIQTEFRIGGGFDEKDHHVMIKYLGSVAGP
jgi:hypothetical protein